MDKNIILSIKDLQVKFKVRDRELTAIRDISLDIEEGKVLAIVGESGFGQIRLHQNLHGHVGIQRTCFQW